MGQVPTKSAPSIVLLIPRARCPQPDSIAAGGNILRKRHRFALLYVPFNQSCRPNSARAAGPCELKRQRPAVSSQTYPQLIHHISDGPSSLRPRLGLSASDYPPFEAPRRTFVLSRALSSQHFSGNKEDKISVTDVAAFLLAPQHFTSCLSAPSDAAYILPSQPI